MSKLRDNNIATLTFDYTHQLTDGIRIWKQESVDGAKWRAAFDIFDRRPYTGAVESSQGVQRIALADENQKAELVISDPQGRPRIRIGVDKAGDPSIVMLSPQARRSIALRTLQQKLAARRGTDFAVTKLYALQGDA